MLTLTDPIALKANRLGEITAEQSKALLQVSQPLSYLGCVVAAALMIVIVAVAGDWLTQHEVIGWGVVIGVLIVSFVITGRITSIPMRRRLANAHVQAVSGEVLWHKSDYAAVADGRTLKSISRMNLPPGHYTFFCLDNTRWLLSAEMTQKAASPISASIGGFNSTDAPVGVPDGNFTRDELHRALAATKEFHAESLESNRDGRMTLRQRTGMVRDSLGLLIIAVGLIALSTVMAVKGLEDGKDPAGAVLAGGVFIVISFFILSNFVHELKDGLGGRVETISGRGSKYSRVSHGSRSSTTHYYYEIGTMRFEVSPAAYHALVEGVVYRAYYAPHSKDLVNIEAGT